MQCIDELYHTAYLVLVDALTSFTFSKSITSIGVSAFEGCSALSKLVYQGTMEDWKLVSRGVKWSKGIKTFIMTAADGIIVVGTDFIGPILPPIRH